MSRPMAATWRAAGSGWAADTHKPLRRTLHIHPGGCRSYPTHPM